ncbi:TatD family hydrolase [Stenotrophomonas sp. YIM B06876]|uniref:TatD family hydrolase n=1 Tax=Stenotrophomonas sp. YIM B06876 TaxID=3060211 RepID=UPI00273A03C9|nr:TatD family hydrolase [Stenotrophomonas sp. YIM B06876]
MQLIDSHCHLDAAEFDSDRSAVMARAAAAGVVAQVVPAVTAGSWAKLKSVCAQHPGLYPAFGLHPMFLAEHRPEHLAALGEWIERERPCAIGECGLDFFIEGLDPDRQRHYFNGQLQLARDHRLPLIVHARRAVEEVILSIRRTGGLRGVVHSFSGSPEQARQLWDLGFLIGLGGPITYPRANRLRTLVAGMPLEFLLLETDAPDQPDLAIHGQRNEPARLTHIVETVAALRRQPVAEIATQTTANARRLFNLPAR